MSQPTNDPPSFEPLAPRETAVDACARALRTGILSGELVPGARLPPERELAARFGVNRVTLRSALAQLASKRLLSVRQGSGYVVRDFRRAAGPDLLPALGELAEAHGELGAVARDLLLVRRHLARAVLEALARGVSARDLAAIGAAVDALERAATAGASSERIAEADVGVVAALVDATRSPVLALCLNPILAVLRELPALRDAMYRAPEENVLGWRALVAWLPTRRVDLVDRALELLEARDDATLRSLARHKPSNKKVSR